MQRMAAKCQPRRRLQRALIIVGTNLFCADCRFRRASLRSIVPARAASHRLPQGSGHASSGSRGPEEFVQLKTRRCRAQLRGRRDVAVSLSHAVLQVSWFSYGLPCCFVYCRCDVTLVVDSLAVMMVGAPLSRPHPLLLHGSCP